jgi:hypothetical protein
VALEGAARMVRQATNGSGSEGPLVAFLGPSLPAAAARAIAPGVELMPPVCRGDLAVAVERLHPRAVLIVDGEFAASLTVRRDEILGALERGVRVLGAAALGAQRAAELDRHGMEGVGAIYDSYRDGALTEDAEVALLHLTAAEGYRPLSWPMVNVRATVAALAASGAADAAEAGAILAAAGRLHFLERTRAALERELAAEGCEPARAAELAHLVEREHVDLKAGDAAAAFTRLAEPEVEGHGAGVHGLLGRAIAWSGRAASRKRPPG